MDEGPIADLPPWALDLFEREPVGHLGLTDDKGGPRVLPVTFAVAGGMVWSAVDDKPKRRRGAELARVRWLSQRPWSAFTVDHYDDDWSQLAWVQLIGATSVLPVASHESGLEALVARYQQYRERPPTGPLLRLVPERALCWSAGEG